MIEKPTVLILGAGASVPYGFPSGRGLKQIILKSLGTSGIMNLRQIMKDLGFEPSIVESFRNDLFYSGWSSVDAFLEYRPKFIEIGKLAIALLLFPFELEDKIFKEKDSENSWYHHLFEKLKTNFDSFDKNKISIITFNYDRSVEHFLFTH